MKGLSDVGCRLGWMQRCGVREGAMYNAMGLRDSNKGAISIPLWGEIQEFDQSPFNPLKNLQQMEANHQLWWLTPSTLK